MLYYRDIPPLHKYRLLGIPLTDKLFVYLLAFQMAISNPPASVISAICGLLSGLLYTTEGTGISRFTLPRWLVQWCSRVALPLLRTEDRSRRTINQAAIWLQMARSAAMQREFIHEQAQFVANLQPTEENIQQIEQMGFTREQAVRALQQHHNNIDLAVASLLDES